MSGLCGAGSFLIVRQQENKQKQKPQKEKKKKKRDFVQATATEKEKEKINQLNKQGILSLSPILLRFYFYVFVVVS